jgi:hypothetical protein
MLWFLLAKEKSVFKAVLLVFFGLLSAAASVALISVLAGGFSNALAVVKHWRQAIPANTYAIQYQSGPWYQFFEGFWIMSPVSSALCLIGICCALFLRNQRAAVGGIIFFFLRIYGYSCGHALPAEYAVYKRPVGPVLPVKRAGPVVYHPVCRSEA